MSNYSTLKAAISAVIKENNNHEITGQVLQTTLLAMVDSLAGGYLFKGIATPATVVGTPDENVFYIGGGGVYSNFGATPVNVPDGCIGIFTYNGSFENHIIPTGGVFDISAYNAVGGTPATYADLTAALGTNGANIPDYLRKGGMSVKFIQGSAPSSDNKYVQYRLMANTWSITVSDWQGVDDEPTAGSENLVKSGGVANDVGAYIVEKTVPANPTGTTDLIKLKVERTPIEFTIDVIENTATFAEAFWIGVRVVKDGSNVQYNNLTEDNGKIYFKELLSTYSSSTEFYIYVRKCTSSGTVKLRINTNNGKATFADINGATLAINVNRLNNKTDNYSDTTTARLAVPVKYRSVGQIISYKLGGNWIIEQFIGVEYNETAWKSEDSTVRWRTLWYGDALTTAITSVNNSIDLTNTQLEYLCSLFPHKNDWVEKTNDIYKLTNPYEGEHEGARLQEGLLIYSSYKDSLVTGLIPLISGARYKLKTAVRNMFDGVAYYTNIAGTTTYFCGYDVFHTDSSTAEVIEAELTIPSSAKYMRLATFNKATAWKIEAIYPDGLVEVTSADDFYNFITEVNSTFKTIKDVLPTTSSWEKQEGGVYELRNFTQNNGSRLKDGEVLESSLTTALITDFIPIEEGEKYRLKTYISQNFDGVAYYRRASTDLGSNYLGHDVFFKPAPDTTWEVKEAELTIPEGAHYMRLGTANNTIAYEIYKYIVRDTLIPVASEEYVQEQLEQYTPSPEYIEQLIENKTEPIEEDIDYLYGVVSAGGTPPELAIRLVPTMTLFLGSDVLDVTNVTYDSNFWTVVNGLPKYLGGTGGGQTKTFKFNASTINNARYLCDIVTLTQDSAYEDLFYLRIGNGPLVDTYNGSRTTFGGFLSDGGCFEIIPYGTKPFDVTSLTLKPLVNSDSDPDYTETRNLPVNNVNCGNSNSTLIDGKWNVAVGPTGNCMANNINGSRSVAIGMSALQDWKYGMQNIGIGTFAMARLKEGNHNIAIGSDCFWQVRKAQDNVIIGRSACGRMFSAQEGVDDYELVNNVVIGMSAMVSNGKNSSNCVAVGYRSNVYGVPNSVFIGSNASTAPNLNITNVIAIGCNVRATKSNQCILGNTDVTEFVLGNKKLIFNQDGTVSWEALS